MGPMANRRFAEVVRGQIADAVARAPRADRPPPSPPMMAAPIWRRRSLSM